MDLTDIVNRINQGHREPDLMAGDFHSANTALIFPEFKELYLNKDPKATKYRKIGKVIGLSLLYQDRLSSAGYTIHYNEGVGETVEEASALTDKWYGGIPSFVQSINNIMSVAKQTKMTTNLFGEKFIIPDVDNKVKHFRRKAMKNAINIPIQSSGSVQTKMIVDRLFTWIDQNKMGKYEANNKLAGVMDELFPF